MLKKAASSVPWLCRNGSHRPGVAILPDLRAHRLAALRGVRAHVQSVRSVRQNGCGLAGPASAEAASRRQADFFEHSLSLTRSASSEAFICF